MLNCNKLRGKIRERYASETQLANDICISKSTLSLYLNGKRDMPIDVMTKIVSLLQLNETECFEIFFKE